MPRTRKAAATKRLDASGPRGISDRDLGIICRTVLEPTSRNGGSAPSNGGCFQKN